MAGGAGALTTASSSTGHANVVPGIPAKFEDLIVTRRLNIVTNFTGFTGSTLTCLDAGCGNGASMLKLSGHFSSCHGVDSSPEYIKQFQMEAERRSVSNCTASTGDLCDLQIESESFDRVISFEVVEHLSDELAGVKSLYRVLKPSGQIAVSVPNKWWVFETHGTWLPILPWHRIPFISWLPEPIHARIAKARIYTKRRITDLLTKGGFRVIETKYVTAPMDRLTFGPLQRLSRKTIFRHDTTGIPVLATAIMAFATRDGP